MSERVDKGRPKGQHIPCDGASTMTDEEFWAKVDATSALREEAARQPRNERYK